MNVGQIPETHLGWAARHWELKQPVPVFDGASEKEITELLKKGSCRQAVKPVLMDAEPANQPSSPVTVGYMYVLKLHHLVDDKIHASPIGPIRW